MSHAGRVSLVLSFLSWIALACALVFGGLVTASQTWLLQALSGGSVVVALLSAVLALVALIKGPQRISGACGLVISVVFLLLFTGAMFSLVG